MSFLQNSVCILYGMSRTNVYDVMMVVFYSAFNPFYKGEWQDDR